MAFRYVYGPLDTGQIPKLEKHPLSAVCDAALCSTRNLGTCHAVMTSDHLTWPYFFCKL
jgi:hypothetical protein